MSSLKDRITKTESIANQTNYVLTGITTMILAAMTAAIQNGMIVEDLMRWLWVLWLTAFVARLLERWLTWYTRVREVIVTSGISKPSLTEPTSSLTPSPS